MADINKIIGVAATAITKVSGVAISGIANVFGQVVSLFTNTQAVSRSLTAGTAQSVYLADSNASGIEFDHDDAYTISFWVKAGWSTALNGNIFLFGSTDVGGGVNSDTFRMWYAESNNRLNIQWRSSGTNRRHQFWLFHSTASTYLASYNAAGLGSSYWTATNRGNVGDDDYTLITFTKGASNSAANSNVSLYWNGTSCGTGFYANGNNAGTPAMGNNDKQVFLGSKSYSGWDGAGNSAETKYDGLTMWNKKLTAAEVSELWNSGTPMNAEDHSAVTNLKGYWEFEGNGNATVGENITINGNSNTETR
jgi:hypothetical protein